MRKLFVHIGTHKTGSSAVQRFMTSRRALLNSNDLYYPRVGLNVVGSHHNLLYEIANDSRYIPQRGGWKDIRKEIKSILRENGRASIILSCEAFSAFPEKWDCLFEEIDKIRVENDLDLNAILFLRPMAEFMESVYIERIKGGGRPITFSAYIDSVIKHNSASYSNIVNSWSILSPNLAILPYDGIDSVESVLSVISPTFPYNVHRLESRVNERISSEHLALIAGHTKAARFNGYGKYKCREISRIIRNDCGFVYDSDANDSLSFVCINTKEKIDYYLKQDLEKLTGDKLFYNGIKMEDILFKYSRKFCMPHDSTKFYKKIDCYKKLFDKFYK